MFSPDAMSYSLAQTYVEERRYRDAVEMLLPLVEDRPRDIAVRILLAQAYFHQALLAPAEEQLRIILDQDPTESYARLMLTRTLERQSRHTEAATHRRLLAVMTGDDDLLFSHRLAASGSA